MLPMTFARFCHRGAPPAVVSPGAVSRFGLAPVHEDRREFDLRFVGARDDFVRALQHCTTRGHTPRILATSPREARPKGRITLSPRAHRLAAMEGDGERRAHEIQPCAAPRGRGHQLEARRPGDIESRALPRRKGSSPGSTMSRAPRGHRSRVRRVWRNARSDRDRSRPLTCDGFRRCTAVLPALERVPRSDAPLVRDRGAFGTFGWRESLGSLREDLLPPASVGVAGSC